VETNGVRLHVVEAGAGPLVVMLHGFPECWYSWRYQIGPLSERFHVVAPDMRGYNLSEKPASGYRMANFQQDVLGLLDYYGADQAVLVGHDWGGAIAWTTAIGHPERFRALIALNFPHPSLFARNVLSNPRQMLRSWYILLFQLPGLPEFLIRQDGYRGIERMIRGTAAHPERFSDEDMAVFKAAAAQPGALTAALNYYRSLSPGDMQRMASGEGMRLELPTLLVWGEKDVALGKELTYGTSQLAPNVTVRYIRDSAHWVQQEAPEVVTGYTLEFLGEMDTR
jgi:pimeloyl-ACP methyl ester carboxylesterase